MASCLLFNIRRTIGIIPEEHQSMISKIGSFILLLCLSSYAANDTWDISLANGDTLFNVFLIKLTDDSLLVSSGTHSKWISIESITGMSSMKGTRILRGMGTGFFVGGAIGAVIGLATYEKPDQDNAIATIVDPGPAGAAFAGGILLGAVETVVGGIYGSTTKNQEVYDLSAWTCKNKLNWLRSNLPAEEAQLSALPQSQKAKE
jgi:hypothetical protein